MKILLDNGVPEGLRKHLAPHLVLTARTFDWATLKNGDLIAAAEQKGFELFITNDKSIRYQQNLKDRKIAILSLSDNRWPRVSRCIAGIQSAVAAIGPAEYAEVEIEP
jgi:hypothetical protein